MGILSEEGRLVRAFVMGDKKIAPSGQESTVDDAATKKVLAAKEEGNLAYKNGDTEGAISAYTKAIHLCEDSVDEATLAICLKNRAAVHLKEEDYSLLYLIAQGHWSSAPMTQKPCFVDVKLTRSLIRPIKPTSTEERSID